MLRMVSRRFLTAIFQRISAAANSKGLVRSPSAPSAYRRNPTAALSRSSVSPSGRSEFVIVFSVCREAKAPPIAGKVPNERAKQRLNCELLNSAQGNYFAGMC